MFKPEQATKTTAFRTSVKITSQFMAPPDSIPLIIEKLQEASRAGKPTKCSLKWICDVSYPFSPDECAIFKCEPVILRVE